MDSPSSSLDQSASVDLSKLTPQDQRELQQFVTNEMQKAKVQQCMHSFFILFLSCSTHPVPPPLSSLPSCLPFTKNNNWLTKGT